MRRHHRAPPAASRRSAAARIELLRPENRRIFAFVRRLEGEDPILVVANLARTMQPASLDLSKYAGLVPVEMSGGTELPRIGETPYFLTLGPYGFYWLVLKRQPPAPLTVRPHRAHGRRELEQLPVLLGADWSRTLGSTRVAPRAAVPRAVPAAAAVVPEARGAR